VNMPSASMNPIIRLIRISGSPLRPVGNGPHRGNWVQPGGPALTLSVRFGQSDPATHWTWLRCRVFTVSERSRVQIGTAGRRAVGCGSLGQLTSGTALRRARGETHAQAEAQERRKPCARERHADDTLSGCPTARVATPNTRRDGAKTTKYPTKSVLHDFA